MEVSSLNEGYLSRAPLVNDTTYGKSWKKAGLFFLVEACVGSENENYPLEIAIKGSSILRRQPGFPSGIEIEEIFSKKFEDAENLLTMGLWKAGKESSGKVDREREQRTIK